MPAQLADNEVKKIVQNVIKKVGAVSPSDVGKCMGPLMVKLKGKADGSLIARLVKEELS